MAGTKLVIVESPAKAKTIKNYLGDGYVVEASVGHVRDIPYPSELPPETKKGPYGKFAVDIHNGFKPYYQVSSDKKKKVTELRRALKEADELYLATDEDREGEAIAWHLMEVLKPKVPVRRMVFHEITKEAIQRALENTRSIDLDLVDAQETRRVLDRLYGFEVSPILWRKIRQGLSAGRVQSPATRLIVDRERERMAHVAADYWSIDCEVQADQGSFVARVNAVGGKPVATGSDFGSDGKTKKDDVVVLTEENASAIAEKLSGADALVTSVTQKPYRRRPAAPFTTSTLQQEASRKLKWNAQTTMRVAQSLYESGHITYMRTDSTALSTQALAAARSQVIEQFGKEALPEEPRYYGKIAKGAQEAHEAIRPSGEKFAHPQDLTGDVSPQQLALYDLIWKRTLASQMNDAIGYTASVKLQAGDVTASASGTVITDPGFRALYQESRDTKKKTAETRLPAVEEGDKVAIASADAEGHRTQPPGRYTEATLVKAMEELGIGRPSTYASTIETIGNRGYVNHRGQYLVPTWLAFATTRLLEENLPDLVDYDFTAEMEGDLDRIAAGEAQGTDFLAGFFFGEGPDKGEFAGKGLREAVEGLGEIDARAINTLEVAPGVTLRNGRYGPYLETEDGLRANVPAEIAPDEMNADLASELLAEAALDGRELGVHPESGYPIVVKTGRYGPYVTEVLPEVEGKKTAKGRTASLFKDMDLATVTLEDALMLMSLPRELGTAPDGEVITAQNGPYGPYLKKGKDSRNLASERQLLEITLEEALEIYSQPKQRGRGTAKPPLREFGEDPVSGKKVVIKDGRFGPYITDGTTNVTVPRAEPVETLTEARAFTLLADKRAKGPAPKRTTTKKTTAKKAPAKSVPAKRATAKKRTTK